jgi:methionyl-tRNA formyltransferase
MRLIFMGSPRFGVPTVEALVAAGHEVALVLTQPDRPAGRGRPMRACAVAEWASERGLSLFQPETLKTPAAADRLRDVGADALVVAAYGLILPRAVLELVGGRAANVHPSLLPRHRGATPIQATLLAGDEEGGVTIIQMVARMDAGPIVAQRSIAIGDNDDFLSLEPRLAQMGAALLVESLEPWLQGRISPRLQEEDSATYCPKLSREDAQLDWRDPAEALWRKVRAYRGTVDTYTVWEDRTLKVLRAEPLPAAPDGSLPGQVFTLTGPGGAAWPAVACGSGALLLRTVMLEGKRASDGDAFLRGHARLVGSRLIHSAAAL